MVVVIIDDDADDDDFRSTMLTVNTFNVYTAVALAERRGGAQYLLPGSRYLLYNTSLLYMFEKIRLEIHQVYAFMGSFKFQRVHDRRGGMQGISSVPTV